MQHPKFKLFRTNVRRIYVRFKLFITNLRRIHVKFALEYIASTMHLHVFFKKLCSFKYFQSQCYDFNISKQTKSDILSNSTNLVQEEICVLMYEIVLAFLWVCVCAFFFFKFLIK